MAEAAAPQEEIPGWSDSSENKSHGFGGDLAPATYVLRRLHCHGEQLPLFPDEE
jgi:hypothetical protein